jgi:NADH dehydrogenase FAD-containing subunit
LLADSQAKFYQGGIINSNLEKRLVNLENGEILNYDLFVLAVGKGPRLDVVPRAAEYARTFRTL